MFVESDIGEWHIAWLPTRKCPWLPLCWAILFRWFFCYFFNILQHRTKLETWKLCENRTFCGVNYPMRLSSANWQGFGYRCSYDRIFPSKWAPEINSNKANWFDYIIPFISDSSIVSLIDFLTVWMCNGVLRRAMHKIKRHFQHIDPIPNKIRRRSRKKKRSSDEWYQSRARVTWRKSERASVITIWTQHVMSHTD